MVTPSMFKESQKYIIYPDYGITGMSLKPAPGRYGQPAKPGHYDLNIRSVSLVDIKLSKAEINKLKALDGFLATLILRKRGEK